MAKIKETEAKNASDISKTETPKSPESSLRKKGILAVCAAAFAVLWLILWYIFPMEWYSVFFCSVAGSYIQIALLSAVLILPAAWLLSLILQRDISLKKNLPVSLFFMIGTLFLFSAFRYTMGWLVAIALILHAAASFWVIASAAPFEKKKQRLIKKPEINAKKQLLLGIASAVLYTVIINSVNIFLFWQMAFIYAGYSY